MIWVDTKISVGKNGAGMMVMRSPNLVKKTEKLSINSFSQMLCYLLFFFFGNRQT